MSGRLPRIGIIIGIIIGTACPQAVSQQMPFGFLRNSCPQGYIPVPAMPGYTDRDFCVMKYEAKNVGGIARSQPNLTPWVNLSRGYGPQTLGDAWKACRDQGPGYDLISNAEWQTIARNIADTAWNWSSGTAYSGQLNQGHSDGSPSGALAADVDDRNACAGTGQVCSDLVWNNQRRTNKLSNGSYIWDFGGNVTEWTRDWDYSTNTTDYASLFGAASFLQINYGNDQSCAAPAMTPYCGFGYGFVDGGHQYGGVARGGASTDAVDAGIFQAVTINDGELSIATWLGFRCVFRPSAPTDPCSTDNPSIGTVCGGGALFAGTFQEGGRYMTTPGGCTDSATPTCSGSTDTVAKTWATAANHSQAQYLFGAANTAYLDASVASAMAAKYCAAMNFGGYSDWHLPSPGELDLLYASRALLGGFATAEYWSSAQNNNSTAHSLSLATGTPNIPAKSTALRVRCVRRY